MVCSPTIEHVKTHPAFDTALWNLRPSQSGIVLAGQGITYPAKVSWEIHGHGPIRVIVRLISTRVCRDIELTSLFSSFAASAW